MNCMSCLGVVVRLNSLRGFNLAHMECKAYDAVDLVWPFCGR